MNGQGICRSGTSLRSTARAVAMIIPAMISQTAAGSALFDGSNPDLWVIDPGSNQVTGYDYNQWLEQFADANYPLSGNQQALINNAPNSSQAMTPGQPNFSLVGLESAEFRKGDAGKDHPTLRLQPAPGSYTETIPLQLLVSAEKVVNGSLQLKRTINGVERLYPLSEEGLEVAGALKQNGYYVITEHLVADDTYNVSASVVNDLNTTLGSASATYTLNSDHPDGFRRDSDGDGIPDLVEAAIGMDPFDSDWFSDADGDGWSAFDLWLREEYVDSATGLPIDSDNDGWSDFDEALRGTNPADPAGVAPTALPAGTEQERQYALRFKDFPAARRLYEVEYTISGNLVPKPAISTMAWSYLGAATISGETTFHHDMLLTDNDLAEAGLAKGDISPRLLASVADTALSTDSLPVMRLPAGSSNVLRAAHQSKPGPEGMTQVYKAWLDRTADADPARHLAENGVGNWNTVAEWKQGFIDYLGLALVEEKNLIVDLRQTETVALMEAAYSRESRLSNLAPLQLFGWSEKKTPSELARESEKALTDLTVVITEEKEAQRNLDDAHQALVEASTEGQALAPTAAWVREQITNPVSGKVTDQAIAERFVQSYDLSEQGCFVTDDALADIQADNNAWADFQAECPEYYTESDIATWQAQDRERVYQVRLHWLPGAAAVLKGDNSLLQRVADSDGDGEGNAVELASPLRSVTLPWLADFDGDGILDGEDLCPRDEFNECSNVPVLPTVSVEATASAAESGYALISVSLDRVRDTDVLISYQTVVGDGDTATPVDDFTPVSGTATIPAGERVALIAVETVKDDSVEDPETFTVEISDVMGANLAGNGVVSVTIADEPVDRPPVVTGTPTYTATVGETLTMTVEDLLSYVEEPDGQTVFLTALLSMPEGQLEGDEAGGALLYLSPAGTEKRVNDNDIDLYSLVIVSSDQMLYNETASSTGVERLVLQNGATLEQTPVTDSNGNAIVASDILTTPTSSLAWIEESGSTEVHLWQEGQPLRTISNFTLPFYKSAVDPRTGDLYTCDQFGTEGWHRTDFETLTSTAIPLACGGSPEYPAALDGQICFRSGRNIDCSTGTGEMVRAAEFTSGSINQLMSAGGNLVVFLSNASVITSDFPQYRTVLIKPDFSTETLLEYPSERYGAPEIHQLSDGSYLFMYANNNQARLYRWSGLASDGLVSVPIGDVALADGKPGDLVEFKGAIYWLRQQDSANRVIETLDPETGARTPVLSFAEGNNWVPSKAFKYGSRLHYLVGTAEGSSDFAQCDLYRLDAPGESRTVVRDISCYWEWEIADQLLFEHYEISFELGGENRYLIRYGDPVFTGTTTFSLQVSDSTGNTVELPVNINVQPAQ